MTNDDLTVNTNGGTSVGKNVQTGRDFVGRDQINFIVPLGNWEEVRRLLFKGQGRATAVKALLAHFESFDWAKAEQAYLDKMIKLYDRVRILGSSADVPLGNLFTQVYILDKPTARYRHDIEELRKRGADRNEFQRQLGERIHGLTLVKTGKNLFILGKPGAGKTTFLKYITVQAARKQLPQVPIFVSLNQWADSRWGKGDEAALLPFLVEQFDICDFPDADLFVDYLLRAGRTLILFDGLDEIKQEKDQRRRLTRLLQDFARKYDKSQYLITCRIAASEYAFNGFTDVEVADFTPVQVREYVLNWFGVEEKKFDAFTIELDKAENKGIAELCNTPLLLSLLCLTFDNAMRFPPSRAELYEDALDTLLRKWDSSRSIQRDEIYRELSHKRKLQLLMSIALPTFEHGELFFRQRDLEQQIVRYLAKLPGAPPVDTIDGTVILKTIEAQHSILVERAQGIYSFSHLTFQEFLTARYLAENQGRKAADELIRSYLIDWRWREVFLLAASFLNDADEFIASLRNAIDAIIEDALSLLKLLVWVNERTQQLNSLVMRQLTIRLAYFFLALANAPYNIQSRTFDFDRALAIDPISQEVIGLAHEHNWRLKHGNVYKNELYPSSDELVKEIARIINKDVAFDYGLTYAYHYAAIFAGRQANYTENDWETTFFSTRQAEHLQQNWEAALQNFLNLMNVIEELANDANLSVDNQQLIMPDIPLHSMDEKAWLNYANTLLVIMRNHRNLVYEGKIGDEEIAYLNTYFYGSELLVQCLNVAVVSNRKAVLNGLFLPPRTWQKEKMTSNDNVATKGDQP